MPPEHQEQRDRQREALRRYVSDLTVQPERVAVARPLLPPVRPRPRPAWPRVLLTLLLMVVSLAGGVAIGANRASQQDAGAVAVATTTASATVGPAATPECVAAVAAANKIIGHALEIERALRERTSVMNALRDGKIDDRTALATATPSLIAGSVESARFDLALADYKKVVDGCKLRAP